jgi:hypothetical protein
MVFFDGGEMGSNLDRSVTSAGFRSAIPLAVIATSITATFAPAAVIVAQYDFEFTPEPQARTYSAASGDVELNSSASAFTVNSAIRTGGTDKLTGIYDNSTDNWGRFPAIGSHRGAALANTASVSSTIDTTKFFEFTATAGTGYELDLASLTFDYNQTNSGDSYSVIVRSSVDSFGSNLHSFSRGGSTSWETRLVDLAPAQFQNLSSITFRFYFTDSSGSNSRAHIVDNVVLSGNVVPEPGSAACAGALAMLALSRRQRRRC